MDLRQLKYFIAIAQSGSMASAAQSLGVAQPSLSQQMKQLEAELSVELLVRSARGVQLTEAGQVLLRHARSITGAV